MKVIVTGGAGYIGSHTVVELINAGMEPVIVDNLCNSRVEVLERILTITGKKVPFYEVNVNDVDALGKVFDQEKPQAVIHFAGLKAVGTGEAEPLLYYRNNVSGLMSVADVMMSHGVDQIVFSSSATVYGMPESSPKMGEDLPTKPYNTYGQTKLMCEEILRSVQAANPEWKVTLLRYFNPSGAHQSGLIGEDPQIAPDNLTPYCAQVLVGRLPFLKIFGNDYDTPDGTGVRDYIHVVDLAKAHVKALEYQLGHPGVGTFNLGTGRGHSVLEMVHSFEKASGKKLPYKIVPRRPGDLAIYYADPSLAEKVLGWKAEKTLDDMCADVWHWQSRNPKGLAEPALAA